MKKYTGIIPAFATPLNDDNTIKEDITKSFARKLINDGADGLYICGATGESVVLQKRARMQICEIVVDEIGGEKPIIAHVGAIDLKTSLELAKHAEKVGADCIASIPPFYFKYLEEDIINYYKELAKAVSIPVMIYYLPAGGVFMDAKLIAEIFKIENVTAVKWSSTNYHEMLKLKDMTHGEMNIINGPDETLVCGLASGVDAAIGLTYNCMLNEFKQIFDVFMNGDIPKATQLQMKANRVIEVILNAGASISALKYALEMQGIMVGNATYPMKRFNLQEKEILKEQFKNAGLIF